MGDALTDALESNLGQEDEEAFDEPVPGTVYERALQSALDPVDEGAVQRRVLSVRQQIAEARKSVTQAQIDAERARLNEQVPFLKRWAYGIDYSDEDLADSIAQNMVFPQGTIGPKRARKAERVLGAAPAAAFGRIQTLFESPGRIVESGGQMLLQATGLDAGMAFETPESARVRAGRERELQLANELPEGASVMVGSAVGEVATLIPGILFPPAAPVVFGVKAGGAAADTFEETGNIQASLGAGVIEYATEAFGFRVIGKLANSTTETIGRAILKKQYKSGVKLIAGAGIAAGIEVTEEQLALVGNEVSRYYAGVQDWNTTLARIREQFIPTTEESGLVGAMLYTGMLLSPRARARFRMGVEAGNQAVVREVLTESGMDEKSVNEIVDSIQPSALLPTADDIVIDVHGELESRDSVELAEASREISDALAAVPTQEEAAKPPPEVVSALEQTKRVIDEELSARQLLEAQGVEQKPREKKEGKQKSILEVFGVKPTGGGVPGSGKINLHPAFAAFLKRKERTAAAIQRDDKRRALSEQSAKFRRILNDVKVRMREDRRLDRDAIRAIRRRLLRDIREQLPKSLHTRLLGELARVETSAQLEKGTAKIASVLADHVEEERTKEQRDRLIELLKIDTATLKEPHRAKFEAIVGELQPKAVSKKKKQQLESREEFVSRPDERIPRKPEEEIQRLYKQAVSKMDADKAEEIADRLDNMLAQNELFDKLTTGNKEIEMRVLAQSLANEIAQSKLITLRKVLESRRVKDEKSPTLLTQPVRLIENLMPKALAKLMGGSKSSTFYNMLYKRVADAFDGQLSDYFTDMDALAAMLDSIGLASESRALASMSTALSGNKNLISAWRTNEQSKAAFLEVVLPKNLELGRTKDTTIKLTVANRIHLMSLLQDVDTYDLIVFHGTPVTIRGVERGESFKLSESDVAIIRAQMSPVEQAISDWMVDRVNGELKSATRAWSFENHRRDITRVGIHFPRRRQKESTADKVRDIGEEFDQVTAESMGIIKERTADKVNPILIEDAFAAFSNFAWQTRGLANLGPAIKRALQLLNSAEATGAFSKIKRGRDIDGRFRHMYRDLAQMVTGGNDPLYLVERGFSRLTANTTKAILGLNPKIMLYQPVAIFMAAIKINPIYLMRAVITGAMFDTRIDRVMHANSPYIRYRDSASTVGLVNEGAISRRHILGLGKKREWALSGIAWMDRTVIRAIWKASEYQARAEGLTGKDAVLRTKQLAEENVKDTQATFDPLHISGFSLEAKNRPFMKILLFFRSQIAKDLSLLMHAWVDGKGKGARRFNEFAKVASAMIASALAIQGISDIYDRLLSGPDDDKDEEEKTKEFAAKVLDRVAGTVVLGDWISSGARRVLFPELYRFEPSNPLEAAARDAVNGLSNASASIYKLFTEGEEIDQDKFWEDLSDSARGIGTLFGVPINALLRDMKKLSKRLEPESGLRSIR